MKDIIEDTIAKQIESCRELLKIFQNERQLYLETQQVGITEVMRILGRKKELVEIFDKQHTLLIKLKNNGGAASPEEKLRRKGLMSQLASLIEQLLVIDHENEKMLRENICCRNIPAPQPHASPAPAPVRETELKPRPHLQRQLPFVPNLRPAAAASAMADSGVSQRGQGTVARHLIKQYARGGMNLNPDSKYA